MTKKPILLLATVAVLAFVLPSTASAAELTVPPGTRGPVGTAITMAGDNVSLTTSLLGTLTCSELELVVKLTKNDGSTIEAGGSNVNPGQAGCDNGSPKGFVTVTNFEITNLFFNESNGPSGTVKHGKMSFTSTIDVPNGVTCKFTVTNVPLTFVSTENLTILRAGKAGGITSTGGCGTATLDAEFTLQKVNGTLFTAVMLH